MGPEDHGHGGDHASVMLTLATALGWREVGGGGSGCVVVGRGW